MKLKVYIFSIIIFLIDLLSKIIVINFLDSLTIIPGFLELKKVYNTGAAFSILSGNRLLFILFALFVLYYFFLYIINEAKSKIDVLCFSFIIGGILGNLFDRLFYGKVVDFISFNLFGYKFPVFNLADSFIVIGALIYIIYLIKGDKNGIESRK